MTQTLEESVEELERKVAELSAQALDLRPRQKDWRRTVGSMPDNEIAREAERLGRKYRQQQTYLLTRNATDFTHVPGLRVENWLD